MTLETWTALAAANLLASIAPGQNVALVGATTVRSGLRGGMLAIGGILVAELVWSCLALFLALGAREVSPTLFGALQAASGAFLLCFGAATLRARPGRDEAEARRRCRPALDGVWIGLANPLALIFFLSLFPSFVAEDARATSPAVLLFYASAVLASSAAGLVPWLALSGALARAGLAARSLTILSGLALIGLGALVLLRLAA